MPTFLAITNSELKHWQRNCINSLESELTFEGVVELEQAESSRTSSVAAKLIKQLQTVDLKSAVGRALKSSVPLADLILDFTHAEIINTWGPPVWRFSFRPEFELPGLAEFCAGHTIVVSTLEEWHNDQRSTLYSSRLPVQWNLIETAESILSSCADWPVKAWGAKQLDCLPSAIDRPPTRAPSYLNLLAQSVKRTFHNFRWKWFGFDTWNVGTKCSEPEEVADINLTDADYLPSHKPFHFIADPFPLSDGSLIVEECDHSPQSKGVLRAVESSLGTLQLRTVLEKEFHLSYPCIFHHQEHTYCIPESYSDRSCSLYRWNGESFDFVRVLIHDREMLDPTILRHQGLWWLFSCPKFPEVSRLEAYYAESLESEWTPHPLNPLKEDICSARPGGQFFELNGKLYRPSQDCSDTYGRAIKINEVELLTTEQFRERTVKTVLPDVNSAYPHGCHHLAFHEDRLIFDAKVSRYDPLLPLKQRFL